MAEGIKLHGSDAAWDIAHNAAEHASDLSTGVLSRHLPAVLARGDMVRGGSGPTWERTALGGANSLWSSDGADAKWQTQSVLGLAPAGATYITQVPEAGLSAEFALSTLATGILKVTTITGALSSLAIPLTIANGGTGQSTIASGAFWYASALDTLAEATLTAAGRALLDDSDAAAQRATLGLGGLAVLSTLPLANLTDGVTAGQPLVAGGAGGDPHYFACALVGGGASSTLTLPDAATSITGGGTLALGGYTLTVPATGTAVLGSGAANRLAIFSDANTLTSSANLTWGAAANQWLAITNTAASDVPLTILAAAAQSANLISVQNSSAQTIFSVQAAGQMSCTTTAVITRYAADGALQLVRNNGTVASPTDTVAGDILGDIRWLGRETGANPIQAQLVAQATENWVAGAHGTRVLLAVTPPGSTTLGYRFSFSARGNLILGTATEAGTSATRTLMLTTDVAPTSSPADAAQLYSADWHAIAGQATLYLRGEDGRAEPIMTEQRLISPLLFIGG